MKLTEKFSRKQIGFGIAGIVVLILLLIYLGIAAFFHGHFLFRTTVNGVNASGKNVKDVEAMISKEIDGYKITVEDRQGQEEEIKGKDIGLQPEFDGSLEKELKKQNGFSWPVALFHSSGIEVETMVEYEEDKLKEQMSQLTFMDETKMKQPQDAQISAYSEKGFEIIPEEQGTALEKAKTLEVLEESISKLQKKVSLEEQECYLKPKLTKESEELKKVAETMNQYAGTKVTYEFGDKQEVLDGSVISQWISVNENQEVQISEEKVSEYIKNLAENYNTAGKPKTLTTTYGSTVTISGGDYGWKIDKDTESQALLEHIKAGENVVKEPAYAKTANSHGANDYGNTYVEVNLTSQHLYYYKNGALVLETDFVSGNEAKGHDTPPGAFGLYYRQRDKTLRGEDYATPVSFWMPFNGGVGFHDATWRNDFGGNYYRTSGSHGCVNMPYSAAKKLYDNIEAGCAVLVYKLSGTENAKSQAQDSAAEVVSAIRNLGDITLSSKGAVQSVRRKYDALGDTAKGYVKNYGTLTDAEAQIAQLETGAADQQAASEAQQVIDAINGLAGVPVTEELRGQVQQVRAQYNGLSDAAKGKVTNYNLLISVETALP